MTRLRTDQACLDAQVQAQIAQSLTAELAVSCPDCGVEAGRSCRDSFDRAVRPHLDRAVAANRRDTVPCPGPDVEEWLKQELDRRCVFSFTTEPDPCGDFLIIRHGEFYARISGKELAARALSRGTLYCAECTAYWTEESHANRCRLPKSEGGHSWVETVCFDCFRTTLIAHDRAPAIAPEKIDRAATENPEPTTYTGKTDRPVCACGQEIRHKPRLELRRNGELVCNDCFAGPPQGVPLDQRIREAQPDDATECAWSTPTSDGEGWT